MKKKKTIHLLALPKDKGKPVSGASLASGRRAQPKEPDPKPVEAPYDFQKELFSLFDYDKKGYIDIAEVKRLLNVFKSSIPSTMASRIIAEVDANGDGKIDFPEFQEMLRLEPEYPVREKDDMMRAFKYIAEDPMYITKKKIEEIISDKRYCPEPIFMSNLEFDEEKKLNYKKAINMFYSLSDLNKDRVSKEQEKDSKP